MQESRDFITQSLVRDLEHQAVELAQIDTEIEKMLKSFDYQTHYHARCVGSAAGTVAGGYRDRMETTYALDMLSPTQNILLSYGDQVQTQRFTYSLEVLSMHFQSLDDHDNGWVPEGDETTYSGEWETLYYLQDELGSIMKVVGANGKKSAHYNYDEFGRPLGAVKFDPNWPGPDNTLGYTGYDYDHYAGLYYANARYYMPEIGRFISEDPWNGSLFNPNTLNKYPYVLNNPMKYVDPLGLRPLDWPQFMQSNSGSTSGLGKAAAKAQWQGETAGISTPNQNGPTVTPIELVVKDNHNLFEKYLRWRLNQHPQLVVNENGESRYTEEEFNKMLNMIPVLGVENLSKNVIKKAGKSLLQKLKQLFRSKGSSNIKYGSMNPGPLPENIAKTFRSATYTKIVTQEEITLYRAYGGKAGELGSYWTKTKPQGPLQTTIDSALDQNWGNIATQVSTIKVPKGTTIFEGAAAEQRGLVGGGNQIFIEKVDPSWLVK
ncbi:RHS repeat-associated core domain-containing protein [Metallumcola ferriviriculae]|uniref:RHS repeat-associated core domain-containing protein n=1 Tax=Metallumcola ferriviriculae TaxID=3039180 RepID=A0AAU0USZ6_9FIRM|nr:RHS repeat-associated core domain-containing protein [Desulfitibacteraceae bacterium MK1]